MENSQPSSSGKRLAAIDIGSNSIRLLVAEAAADGSYRVLDDEKQTTRLAQGLAETGRLAEGAVAQSLEALGRMKSIAEGYDVERLEVIATSAVREARNRKQFLNKVHKQLGLDVEVISALQEGQLSFASVASHFDLKAINAVIADLGGGSVELVFAAKGVVEEICSLPLGAVRLTDAFIHSDPLADSDLDDLKKWIRKSVKPAVARTDFLPHLMIGAGGTFLALANISMKLRGKAFGQVSGYEMNRSEVRHIFEYLKFMPLRARRKVPGLNADRADIILAGLVVIERLMKYLNVNRLQIHDQGVRDGLLLRMIAQGSKVMKVPVESDNDPLAGVRQFAAACSLDQKHSEHVMRLARQIVDQLEDHLCLAEEERIILEAAALLHEVGYLINYERHHQHSYHLIMNGNMRGLTPKQRELAANVARYHRRSTPKPKHENYARLAAADQETVCRLSAILRLADGLDRTHTQGIKEVRCAWQKDCLTLTALAEQNPEVDLWSAQEKSKLFEKVFDVKLEFAWQQQPPLNGKEQPALAGNGKAKVE